MNSIFCGAHQAKVNKVLYAVSEETIPLPLIFPSRIILVWKSCNSVWSFPKRKRNKITWANIDVFYRKEMNTLHRNTRSYSSGQFCFLCDCYPSEVKIVIGTLLLRLQGWVAGYGSWEVTVSHGGKADHEEDTGMWWLKCQPWFFPTFLAHGFVSETQMKYWCFGNPHVFFTLFVRQHVSTDSPALS